MKKNANELLREIKDMSLIMEGLLRSFNCTVAHENNQAYLCGLDSDCYVNYEDRYSQLKEELESLQKELPELFNSALSQLERLRDHSCTYEDGYCTVCGRDGYA